MHFSLVKIRPASKTSFHSFDAFDDVIFPMYFALKRLDFDVEVLINKTNPRSCNIIFGSFLVAKDIGNYLPNNSIIYNLEQIVPNGLYLRYPDYISHLRSFEVWDYSEMNIKFLQGKNIQATYAPLGYVPEMSRLTRKNKLDIELLFYGAVPECRKALLDQLNEAGVQLHIDKHTYGSRRDLLISRSKAVLNIHSFYTPARLEEVRLGYLWANKIPVISEIRYNTSMPEHLKKACLYASYDTLVEETKSFVSNDKKLAEQGIAGFLAFSSKPLETSLKQLIGKKIHSISNIPQSSEKNIISIPILLPPNNSFLHKLNRKKDLLERSLNKRINILKRQIKTIKPFNVSSRYSDAKHKEWLIKEDIKD